MSSIFTKLISGEWPSYEIYQDEEVFAFLDIRPISLGHTLVIPKEEIDMFTDVPTPLYLKVMEKAQHIGKAVHAAAETERVALIVQGFEVPHFHVHIIPVNLPGELKFSRAKDRSEKEMLEMQGKIVDKLGALSK